MFPPLTWAGGYRLGFLKGDVIAGLTIGIMGIPQGMAYALIAGARIPQIPHFPLSLTRDSPHNFNYLSH
jgi:MFS superfamily sulfate permease-like transporter